MLFGVEPLRWGRGLAHFPPGTAVLGHGPEGSMGPRLSLPLRTVVGSGSWGGPWDMAVSWFSRAESISFGSLMMRSCYYPTFLIWGSGGIENSVQKGKGKTDRERRGKEKGKRARGVEEGRGDGGCVSLLGWPKQHRPGGVNNRKLSSDGSGGWKSSRLGFF